MCRVLLDEIGPVVLEKESKILKIKITDRQTGGRRTNIDQESSLKLPAQIN